MTYNFEDKIDVMYSEEQVTERVNEMAAQINLDYQGKKLHIICVLRGSVFFMTELAKRITVPVTIDFMCVSSYGNATKSSENILMKKDLDDSIENKDVLVVEDIVDSGRTLSNLLELLKERNPASLKLCTLLNKPDRRVVDVDIDYNGFTIPDEFVVGYGLDYAQKYRNIPFIGIVRL